MTLKDIASFALIFASACSHPAAPPAYVARASVTGNVVGSQGQPLPAVNVQVRLPAEIERLGYVILMGTTNDSGRFSAGLGRLSTAPPFPAPDTTRALVIATASGAPYQPRADGTFVPETVFVRIRFAPEAPVTVLSSPIRIPIP